MTNEQNREAGAVELRRCAEDRLAQRCAAANPTDKVDVQRLLHELQVHQIELEMQNDELCLAHIEAEEALNQFVELNQHLENQVATRTTELLAARDAAEASNLAKSRFLANMSHEIRTPLNAIIGMAYLIRRAGIAPEQEVRLEKIDMAGAHLLEIINAILDLSKIEAGKFVLDEIEVRPEAIMKNVVSMISAQVQAKMLGIVVENQALDRHLLGDPTRLQQALLNYASNAIKFTQTGRITLRTSVAEETVDNLLLRFEVEDTGIGIAPEMLARLFSAFEQGDNSITRQYGGTGLGLTITSKFAQLMDGQSGVTSFPGVGSTFWFTARLKKGISSRPEMIDPLRAHAESTLFRDYRHCRILLVEDEAVNREVALDMLQSIWQNINVAVDGAEAVEFCRNNNYDLILMDMQMPIMDGLEATRQIRLRPRYASTPILAMTANAFLENKAQCLDAGMNDFLTKPVDPDMLFATILRYLSRQ